MRNYQSKGESTLHNFRNWKSRKKAALWRSLLTILGKAVRGRKASKLGLYTAGSLLSLGLVVTVSASPNAPFSIVARVQAETMVGGDEAGTMTADVASVQLVLKDTIFNVGDKWNPADNIVSLTNDSYTIPYIDLEETLSNYIFETNNVNTSKTGTYTVEYYFWEGADYNIKHILGTATVTVVNPVTKYTVTFNTNGGNTIPSQTVKVGDYPTNHEPIRDGYIFAGWYTDSSLTKAYNYDFITGNTTLYAKWTKDQTAVNVKNLTLTVGSSWKATDNIVSVLGTNGKALSPNTGYTVTYAAAELAAPGYGNPAAGGPFAFNAYGKVDTKTPGTYTVKYYEIAPDASKPYDTGGFPYYSNKVLATATVSVVSVVNPVVKYSANFNSNGGSKVATQSVISGKTIAKPANPTKTGYVFTGWYSDSALTKAYNFSSAVKGNVTLYAKWAKDQTTLKAKNVTFSQFGTWNNQNAFVSATSALGAKVDFSKVSVKGTVNTAKTGNYTLTYSYGGKTATATVSIIAPQVIYDTQVQRIGWQKDPNNQATWFTNGQEAGTNGRSLRMESIKIALRLPNGMTGSIIYDAHVQRVGWQNAASPNTATATPQTISPESEWFKNGATAGTVGRALRMEAFTIKLTGNIAKYYDVKYDSHVQNYGWQYASKGLYYQAPNFETPAPVTDWFKNGQEVGTNDHALRMEALMITLVAK